MECRDARGRFGGNRCRQHLGLIADTLAPLWPGFLAPSGVALVVVDARHGRAPRRVAVSPSILPTAGLRLALEF